ncbi:MFS transporter [Pelagerythrobacter marensis]|uniref:MFS transporter n=1 Tax=Pelagerythrobacter marensis TaxID=543877 RepID=A0ABZ2DBE8_9SPHN
MNAPAHSGPLPLRIKLANGFGAIAFGVKDNGFSVFLLTFYNLVLGMEAWLVSLALVLALIIDAFVDPVLGNLSDRTYTRWGRRLPWLYIAPIPLGIAWYVLWSPPVDGPPSFALLLGMAVLIRLLLSACEVPSAALVPELTRDYDERTTLFRFRYLFGWTGGLALLFLTYSVFLSDGLLDREGYEIYGLVGAVVIVVTTLLSALGQHKFVARYPETKPPSFSVKTAFGEIVESFSERAFLIFALGAVAAYITQGMTFALSNYLFYFVWEFTEGALAIYPFVLLASVVIVFLTLGTLHRRFGKIRVASGATILATVFWLIPYGLRLAGVWPEVGSATSTAMLFAFVLVSNSFTVMVLVSASSMVAEIVEAFEERTGRRAEGAFYSGNWFVQKCATGLGILTAGVIVSLSGLPSDASPGNVAAPVIDSVIVQYCIMIAALGLFSAWWLARFPIDRADHEARLAALDAAARGDLDANTMAP